MLRDTFQKISNEFTQAINEPYVGHPLANYIRNSAPKILKEYIPQEFNFYKTKGSCGQDKWSNNRGAWIAILDPKITTGASKGYYLVYGFPVGTSEFVFGLSQGYFEAEKIFKNKWEDALEQSAELMKLKIPDKYSHGFKSGQPVFSNLDKQSKDKGYRVGYSYHKIYDGDNLPSEEALRKDLVNMCYAYNSVASKGGRNLDIPISKPKKSKKLDTQKYEDNEESYQNSLPKKNRKKSPKSAKINEKEKSIVRNSETKIRPRNPDYGEEAKENAQYMCEISNSHKTFKRKSDNNNFVEAHHLIPYEQYDLYADIGLCIDRAINIVALCPNCHRRIHHGTDDEVEGMLEKLYITRGKGLYESYICDLEELKRFYKL